MSDTKTQIHDGENVSSTGVVSILMIGQSNMAGRGELSDVEPIKNPDCYSLRMGRWQPMIEPVNPDRPHWGVEYPSGVSLAASFADELSRHLGGKVGLIPAADGGTSILKWMPGTPLFDYAVMLTKLAMRISDFGGIIWHQGESDCFMNPDEYTCRLVEVMTEFRRQIGCGDFPIILGEVSESCAEKWNISKTAKEINRAIHNAAEKLGNASVASSAGLALKPDGIHFNSVSLRELGRRYFEEYKKVTNK